MEDSSYPRFIEDGVSELCIYMKIKILLVSIIVLFIFSSNVFATQNQSNWWIMHVSGSQVKSKFEINNTIKLIYSYFNKYCPNKKLKGNTVDVILNTVSTNNDMYLYSSCINVVKGHRSSIRGMTCSLYYAKDIPNNDKLKFVDNRLKGNVKAYCKR